MEKKCFWCGNKKVFFHLNRLVCEKCFVRLIERRVQKGLGRVLKKNEKVLVIGDLARYFLKNSVKNLPLKITKKEKRPLDISRFDKVVIEDTMDDVDAGFLAGFFEEDFKVKKKAKIIKILKSITDEEAVRFARIKKINFEIKEKNKMVKSFLKKISEKHPEVRFNLLKNVGEIEKLK